MYSGGIFLVKKARTLLIGPHSGTSVKWSNFIAPPLGIHKIASYLNNQGLEAKVIDPDLEENPYTALGQELGRAHYDFIGISTLHITLENDAALLHFCKQRSPDSIMLAGGQEVTFDPATLFSIAPADIIVRGEGEKPMLNLVKKYIEGNIQDLASSFKDVDGLFIRNNGSWVTTGFNAPLNKEEFEAIFAGLDPKELHYERYWNKTLSLYQRDLQNPKLRDKREQEIYSIRLVQSNYCPFKCSFCSSTNFQNHSAGERGTKIVSLSSAGLISLIEKAYEAYPLLRTVLIQDDNFLLTGSAQVKEITDRIIERKKDGRLPEYLSFLCQSRIDTATPEILGYLSKAGFRMIGYGVESFSTNVLKEFNKRITPERTDRAIRDTLANGILPFINVILTSPESTLDDVFVTADKCIEYIGLGAECGAYPYVIPLPGAAITENRNLHGQIFYEEVRVPNTNITFKKPTKMLPKDSSVMDLFSAFEENIKKYKEELTNEYGLTHIPSRINSLMTFHTLYQLSQDMGLKPYSERAGLMLPQIQHLLSQYGAYSKELNGEGG